MAGFIPLRAAKKGAPKAGFTIIELMIATAVFSMVVILITVGVLSFTKAYYKGVNQSTTQNTSRVILEQITQAIQFSGGTVMNAAVNGDARGLCIGNQLYSYLPGKQLTDETTLGTDQVHYALVQERVNTCTDARNIADEAGVAACVAAQKCLELLKPGMRVSNLSLAAVGTTTDTYKVSLRIVFGDNDLLVNAPPITPTSSNARCGVGIGGSQYCAQSELTTIVKKRITQ